MESSYTVVYVVNISKLFRGFGPLRELLMEHAPWSWGDNDRTLVTPGCFKEFFEKKYWDLDIENTDTFGAWEAMRAKIDALVLADKKPRQGCQNDHYIDLEN